MVRLSARWADANRTRVPADTISDSPADRASSRSLATSISTFTGSGSGP